MVAEGLNGGYLSSAELYDFRPSGRGRPPARWPAPTNAHTATLLPQWPRWMVAGGYNGGALSSAVLYVQVASVHASVTH